MQTETAPGPLASYAYRALIAVGIVALAVLAWRLSNILIIVFGGIVLAAALRALSNFLVRHTPLSPRWALAVVVVALVVLVVVLVWLVGAQIAAQLQDLFKLLPDALARARAWLEKLPVGETLLNSLQSMSEGSTTGALSSVARFASGTFGALADAVVILFLGLYLAADPSLYRRGLLHLIPVGGRERVRYALDASGEALRKWLMGQLGAMVVVFILTYCGLSLLGVPLALSLALIAGFLEFIPFIGPILSAVPGVLVAFTVGPQEALYVALLYLVIHQLEGDADRAEAGGGAAACARHRIGRRVRMAVRLAWGAVRSAADGGGHGGRTKALRRVTRGCAPEASSVLLATAARATLRQLPVSC